MGRSIGSIRTDGIPSPIMPTENIGMMSGAIRKKRGGRRDERGSRRGRRFSKVTQFDGSTRVDTGKILTQAEYESQKTEEINEAKKKKKKACKPSKGKKFARRVKGRCVSYGQAGKAKGGGARIKPGTGKGNAYCARSYGDMKSHGKDCSGKDRGTPLCLSRQKWKCSGKYSRKGK